MTVEPKSLPVRPIPHPETVRVIVAWLRKKVATSQRIAPTSNNTMGHLVRAAVMDDIADAIASGAPFKETPDAE